MTGGAGARDLTKARELPTWQELLDWGEARLREAGVGEAQLDAWYLLAESFPIDRVHFLMDRGRQLYQPVFEKGYPVYEARIEKRARRIPLQHILGSQEFMGLSFLVNDQVLIPRQDTETLVEQVLRDYPDPETEILDLCTGSGCIGLSLAVLGKYRSVTAADISREALKVAGKNGKRLFLVQKDVAKARALAAADGPGMEMELTMKAGEKRRFLLKRSDLFQDLDQGGQFDVIVSNPPYIPSREIDGLEPEVRDHEPRLALDGAEDGLFFYRKLAGQSRQFLKPGGAVYFEIGWDQGEEVGKLLTEAGFSEIQVIKDEPGKDRVVKALNL